MGSLQEMGPPELGAHLFLNPQKCTSYAVVRSEAMSFMEAKVGARPFKDSTHGLGELGQGTGQRKREGESKDSAA